MIAMHTFTVGLEVKTHGIRTYALTCLDLGATDACVTATPLQNNISIYISICIYRYVIDICIHACIALAWAGLIQAQVAIQQVEVEELGLAQVEEPVAHVLQPDH